MCKQNVKFGLSGQKGREETKVQVITSDPGIVYLPHTSNKSETSKDGDVTEAERNCGEDTSFGHETSQNESREGESEIPLIQRLQTMADEDLLKEPITVQQALSRPDADKWKRAMDDEMESLRHNQTWDLEPIPANKSRIGCKWIFKLKKFVDGRPARYKARLVAQGFSQRYGVDYDEVFALVVQHATLRVLLSIAGKKRLMVRHLDAKTAFLNGRLNGVAD